MNEQATEAAGRPEGAEPREPRGRRWPWFVLVAFVALVGGAGGLLFGLLQDLPEIQQIENYTPSAATRVYSTDGQLLGSFFIERRLPVRLSAVPPVLRQAVIAIEDQSFYSHIGIDLQGIARAIWADLQAGEFAQGGSTITQQLARGLFLNPEKNLRRKLKEALLAVQIERRYTKDEILERYLNQIYLGSGAYGVEAAAQKYFGKKVGRLDLAEAALIAGLPRFPSLCSPLVNPTRARLRRHTVLARMYELGYIGREQMVAADREPIRLTQTQPRTLAPYFVEYIRQMLEEKLGQNALYKGGLTVNTTLDWKAQEAAEAAVAAGLAGLDARVQRRYPDKEVLPQVGLVAIDPHTGEIRAMIGGRDFQESRFNRAVQARRQPGSAFKPIIYSYAMEAGFTPASRVLDAPLWLPGGSGGAWHPTNYRNSYRGVISLLQALQTSQNTAAVRLLARLGVTPVIAHARRLGIESPLGRNLSLALGSHGVTLCELTSAYTVFDNAGIRLGPTAVREVRDSLGRLIWKPERVRQRVMSEQGAWEMTTMLRSVIEGGTGTAARKLERPLAGKTGTTSDFRDALFVGYSPELAAGVWVGYDDCTPLGRSESGAMAALPVWIEFMREALKDVPVKDFEPPKEETPGYVLTGAGPPAEGAPAPAEAAPTLTFTPPRPPASGLRETTTSN